jgi:hypothetical protein
VHVLGPHWEPWVFMILPPGGFFTLGLWLLIFSWWKTRKAASVKPRIWPHRATVQTAQPALASREEVPA